MSKAIEQKTVDHVLAKINANLEKNVPYWERCADQYVAEGHFCGGCPIGQFYCGIHKKWRAKRGHAQ